MDAGRPRRGSPPTQESDEQRFRRLERKVDDIRDMLISEPEASPLGRALLRSITTNRRVIDDHEDRIDILEKWQAEWRGSWRLVTGAATVLGIIGAFFGVLAYISHP